MRLSGKCRGSGALYWCRQLKPTVEVAPFVLHLWHITQWYGGTFHCVMPCSVLQYREIMFHVITEGKFIPLCEFEGYPSKLKNNFLVSSE